MKKFLIPIIVLAIMISTIAIAQEDVKADGKYGVILEPTMEYDSVFGFYNGKVSVVSKKTTDTSSGGTTDKYGAVDLTGREIIPCIYPCVSVSNAKGVEMILVKDDESIWRMYDFSGNLLYTYGKYEYAGEDMEWAYDGYIPFKTEEGTRIYLNFDGTEYVYQQITVDTIPFEHSGYDSVIELAQNYLAMIQNEDKVKNFYILNDEGNIIADLGVYDGYLSLPKNNKEARTEIWFFRFVINNEMMPAKLTHTLVDCNGNIIVTDEEGGYASFTVLENNILAKDADSNWYFLDMTGKVVSKIGKYKTYENSEKYVFMQDEESNWDLYRTSGEFIKSIGKYETIYYFYSEERYFLAKDSEKCWYILNATNEERKSIGVYSTVDNFNNQIIAATKWIASEEDYVYEFYSFDGTKLLDGMDIRYYRGFDNTFYITDKQGNMTVYDYELNQLCKIDGMEAVGGYSSGYGYIPVKINGKWGIYKIGEGKNQSDNLANNSTGNLVDNPAGNQQNITTEQTTTPMIGTKTDCPPAPPARVKIKKITKGRKKAKITLKKVKSVSGYVVQYSKYKNFKKVKKITTKKTKITVKKLQSKKVYYFRAVAYIKFRGTRFYSTKWSKTKKVRIK